MYLISTLNDHNLWRENISPLSQFEIRDLLSLDVLGNFHLSLTNIGFYLILGAFVIFVINLLGISSRIISNKWSISLESLYATIHSIVANQINSNSGQIYFPFIYTLFIFILINNLMGMIPYSFASTSHFAVTFSLSFTIVLGATLFGLYKHNLEFFSLFVPAGCPLALLPLLVIIELISYLARNISLGLRLAANIKDEIRYLINMCVRTKFRGNLKAPITIYIRLKLFILPLGRV